MEMDQGVSPFFLKKTEGYKTIQVCPIYAPTLNFLLVSIVVASSFCLQCICEVLLDEGIACHCLQYYSED
jgi:hypothetical protein